MNPKSAASSLQQGSLVLYKHDPARVTSVGQKKIQIALPDGESLSVRHKDVTLLHPGPLDNLDKLDKNPQGEIKVAWQLLSGRTTTLDELTELAYGEFTPQTAWATWQWVEDGLYFEGAPDEITVHTKEAVAEEKADREARAAEQRAWENFLTRVKAGEYQAEQDKRYLIDVEQLALGKTDQSHVLSELNRSETPENAHALLLEIGYWDYTKVPYPERLGVPTTPPDVSLPASSYLEDEERVDLTYLPAFAIDDQGSRDPDDAISLEVSDEGRRLWVHVADVAALVTPDSEADLEARARGATLYLPDGNVTMLPRPAIKQLGMGLDEISPALSFGIDLDADDKIKEMKIVPSQVRVTRLTYEEADQALERKEEPLYSLHQIAQAHQARRQKNGAVEINLPETKVWVEDGKVMIRPLSPLRSRALVREAMLMAGKATGRLALDEGIPLPFTTQDPPDTDERPAGPDDLAGMLNLVRHFHRSERSSSPGFHAGLGMALYVQATSPLRRYLDLVVHQQLRAYLHGDKLLEGQAMMERIGSAEAVAGEVRTAERLSQKHWKLVYLMQHPDWRGEGVLVEKWDRRGKVIIPKMDLETRIHLREDLSLNSTLKLQVMDVDLPALEAYFRPV